MSKNYGEMWRNGDWLIIVIVLAAVATYPPATPRGSKYETRWHMSSGARGMYAKISEFRECAQR